MKSVSNNSGLYSKSFTIGICLNIGYVIAECFYGFRINSSALIADAGHNASDVVSMVIAWTAIWLSKFSPFGKYTYGLRKTTILSASINGILIMGAAMFILLDAIRKIRNPVPIEGDMMIVVAAIGIVVNSITAWLFMKPGNNDLNIKGTFLHMVADAAVSAGVVTGGIIIRFTGAYWIDPLISFIIVIVILYSATGLLINSFKLSVDAVPDNIDLEEVRNFLKHQEGVIDIHELHIWALSTTETALTAHLIIPEGCDDSFLEIIQQKLREKYNIGHCTLQIENKIKDELYQGYHI